MAIALAKAPWEDKPSPEQFRAVRHHNESLDDFLPHQTTHSELGERLFAIRECVAICPQVTIGPYRVDFAIAGRRGRFGDQIQSCIVECDGHNFHSSALQRAFDKQRQDYLEGLGIPVVRFTGSQIFREPNECAMRVIQQIRGFVPLPPEELGVDEQTIENHAESSSSRNLALHGLSLLRWHRARFGT